MSEPGSFDWYQELTDLFFKHITDAIIHADRENSFRMENVFPHISRAKREHSWEICPQTTSPVILNIEDKYFVKPIPEQYPSRDEGSMSRYLFGSGGFLTSLANAILYADETNRKAIGIEYPQMIAAFKGSWHKAPDGFEKDNYLSKAVV
jgi:hypothetical protein